MAARAALRSFAEPAAAGRPPAARAVLEARLASRFAEPDARVVVATGAQALTLGLAALGAQPGWVCALPAWRGAGAAQAVVRAGLRPWLLDVEAADQMLRPETVLRALARAPGPVAAALPVCAFGRRPDLGAWAAFREATAIPVLVDAAAAFDTLDSAAIPGVVSLPGPDAGDLGEGGFLATTDAALAARMRALTDASLSEDLAAAGLAALEAWPATRGRYLRAARLLRIALAAAPEAAFQPGWGLDWVSADCAVRLDRPAAPVAAALAAQGIEARAAWNGDLHASPAFPDRPRAASPAAEALAKTTLGLPFWPDMTAEEAGRIGAALGEALRVAA